jgi:RND family efflux transporter MFP subunit
MEQVHTLTEPEPPRNGQPHDDPDHVGVPPAVPRVGKSRVIFLTGLGVAAVAGAFWLGWVPHRERVELIEARAERMRNSIPRVNVVAVRQAGEFSESLLPGNVQALEETVVYARTTGYLNRWLVDIGDEVQAGQLLAEIDTPEVDQQLEQARAQLGQLQAKLKTAEAAATFAAATFDRYAALLKTESVTAQEYDDRLARRDTTAAAVDAAQADIAAGQANVNRLVELQSFSMVYAPFSGTITRRTIEIGQLVTTGTNTAQPLFQISKTDPVRVFIDVPQMYAPGVEIGLETELVVRELPNEKFVGTVTRTSRSIDQATRTLLTEIRVPNPNHKLLTGSYVQVKLRTRRQVPPLIVPATAIIVNAEGSQVAIVEKGNSVRLRSVEIEGNIGSEVGLSSGLEPGMMVVTNPGDRLRDGQIVQINSAPDSPAEPTSASPRPVVRQAASH